MNTSLFNHECKFANVESIRYKVRSEISYPHRYQIAFLIGSNWAVLCYNLQLEGGCGDKLLTGDQVRNYWGFNQRHCSCGQVVVFPLVWVCIRNYSTKLKQALVNTNWMRLTETKCSSRNRITAEDNTSFTFLCYHQQ